MRGIQQLIPIPTPAQPASPLQELPEQPEREQPAAHGAQVIVLYNWPTLGLPAS